MPTLEIVKAWKDAEYRDTLTAEQRDAVPEHPSGDIEPVEFGQKEESSFAAPPIGCGHKTGVSTYICCRHSCLLSI